MYARTTTIDGKPEFLDKAMIYTRDRVMPAVSGMDGYVGISMLADRTTGRSIITTSWEDAEALRRSGPEVRGMRARATDILQGTATVEEWEIILVHRAHPAVPGARTRVVWIQGDPSRLDGVRETFRLGTLPRIENLDGFCSVSVMADRRTGRCAVATTYVDSKTMEAAQEAALVIRRQFTLWTALTVTGAQAFELVLAHLRVPETV